MKILKTIRNSKLLHNANKEDEAKLILESDNLIEVDTDDIVKN